MELHVAAVLVAVAVSVSAGATAAAGVVPTGRLLVVAEAAHESGGTNYPSDVYVVDTDGRHLRNLTHDGASNGWAQWTPDGKQVIFASHRSNTDLGPSHIYVVNADGSARRRLTSAMGGHAPALSPDGRRIAFVVDRPPVRTLYVMNADGGGTRPLARQRDARAALYGELGPPDWSADGRWIVFTHTGWGGVSAVQTSLFAVKPDGSRPTLLEHSQALEGASWAPRGDTLLVIHDYDFTIAHIRLVGGRPALVRVRKIKPAPGGYFAGWSPDARSILVNASGQLRIVSVDGRTSRPAPANAFSLSWSTDEKWIAFARSRVLQTDPIQVARSDGRNQRVVTRKICCLLDDITWAPR